MSGPFSGKTKGDLRTGNAVSDTPLIPRGGLGVWWFAIAFAAAAAMLLLAVFAVAAFFLWRTSPGSEPEV